jgi:alpha-tubulin suppressor-like RCC1 family protein
VAAQGHPGASRGGIVGTVKRRLILLLVLCVIVLIASCNDATQVNVVLRSNVAYASGMSVSLWASHSGAGGGPLVQSSDPWLADGELGDVYVTPQPGSSNGALTVRVAMGVRGKPASECSNTVDLTGCIVAQRKLSFVPHTKLKVPVVLYAACEGIKCSDDTTCSYLGTCVSAQVDPAACATPEGCLLAGEPEFVPGTQGLKDAGTDLTADVTAIADVDAGAPDANDSGPQSLSMEPTAGANHTCARLDDGRVKCWGLNTAGGGLGLGDVQDRGDGPGEMGANLPAVDLGPGRTALELAVGTSYTCARLDDGSVKCWGNNLFGGPGLGDLQNRGDGPGEMGASLPAVALGPGRTALQISASNHTCARLDDGSVKCWGNNSDGQLGLADVQNRGDSPGAMGANLPAVDLGPGRTALQISAGGAHTCARLDDGSVKCWGNNSDGQLGLGDVQNRGDGPGEMGASLPAVDLGPGRTALQISAGFNHTCARLDDGSVKCWGLNSEGQLGLGDVQRRGDGPGELGASLPAVALGPGRTALQISAGAFTTCARLDNGSVKCWGLNGLGQLGLGDVQRRGDGPGEMGANLPAVDLGPGRTALQISAGYYHTCARLDDGSLKCWGYNLLGQLGLGDEQNRGDGPAEMGANLPVVQLK